MGINTRNDIELVDVSKDGKTLAWTENVNGYSNICTKRLRTKKFKKYRIIKGGCHRRSKDISRWKRIGAIMTTPKSPPNIYIIDLG